MEEKTDMVNIFFRFYANLNKFFSPDKDGQVHQHKCYSSQSIKDRIEAMGIPHAESKKNRIKFYQVQTRGLLSPISGTGEINVG